MQPHRGTLILIFGILGLVVCSPLAVVAWVMGHNDLKAMDAGNMDPAGRSNTQAGKICGIIGTILFALGIVIAAILIVVGLAAGLAGAQHSMQ